MKQYKMALLCVLKSSNIPLLIIAISSIQKKSKKKDKGAKAFGRDGGYKSSKVVKGKKVKGKKAKAFAVKTNKGAA